jgi:predicted RNA-binding protein with PIN domain
MPPSGPRAPRRTIVLDAYNVILRSPAFRPDDRRDLAAAREKLVNLLSWTVGEGEAEFVLVFDGAEVRGGPAPRGSGRVRVLFSRPPETADDVIRRLVEEWAPVRENVTVVTSDLEVARHARSMGASLVLSDVFAASLFPERTRELEDAARGERRTGSPTAEGSDAEAKPAGLSRRERDEWLELFAGERPEDEETPDLPKGGPGDPDDDPDSA